MKIFNLGSLNIDYTYSVQHFVRPGETLSSSGMERFPGGKGLNQSISLSKAGASVCHVGIIGKDGEFLAVMLKNAGVGTDYIKISDTPTGHAIIEIDPTGQNRILIFNGANHRFDRRYAETALENAEKGDFLLIQNEINCLEEIIDIAFMKGMQIAFNPSPFDDSILELPLEKVDWWLCNELEAEALSGGETETEKQLDALKKRFPSKHFLITLGKNGSVFADDENYIRQPVFSVKAVDTTGAGDTFTGFFLAMIMNGKSAIEALRTASAASAIAVSRNGAACSVPTLRETEDFLYSMADT